MIRTIDGREFNDVSGLRKGDIFHTDRNGTLPWSPWFKAVENPRYKTYFSPIKAKRWGILAEMITYEPSTLVLGWSDELSNRSDPGEDFNCHCVLDVNVKSLKKHLKKYLNSVYGTITKNAKK